MHKLKLSKKIFQIAAINLALFTLTFFLIIIPSTVAKQLQYTDQTTITQAALLQLLQQAEQLFQTGRLTDAVTILQQAIRRSKQSGNTIGQAAAQTNLSVAFEQLGLWFQASVAINTSLNLLGWDC